MILTVFLYDGPASHHDQRRILKRERLQRRDHQMVDGDNQDLRRRQRQVHHRVRGQMTTLLVELPFAIPERIWFANTDMKSFNELPRNSGDSSAFSHWLDAGRLFVTPTAKNPRKYNGALMDMMPGDPVFAYESQVGFVALGWVHGPKDLQNSHGGTALYPKPDEIVRSLAVDWDTSVTRNMSEVSACTRVGQHGLQGCKAGTQLHTYMAAMLQEANRRRQVDADAQEADALKRIKADPKYDSVTRTQLVRARVGQGWFRDAVLSREPACRVTGITQPRCLVASHIKPWAVCADGEHLDDANGLMLAPHIDHLFDTGLISFTDDGQLLAAPALDRAVLHAWHIDERANVGMFAPDQALYLAYHRRYVLGQPGPRRQRNLVGDAPADITPFDDLVAARGEQ